MNNIIVYKLYKSTKLLLLIRLAEADIDPAVHVMDSELNDCGFI
jgi:hypothetical protein